MLRCRRSTVRQVRYSNYTYKIIAKNLNFSLDHPIAITYLFNIDGFRVVNVNGRQRYNWTHDQEGSFGLCSKDPHYRRVDGRPPTTPTWTGVNRNRCKFVKSTNFCWNELSLRFQCTLFFYSNGAMFLEFMGCGSSEKYSWSSLEKYNFNDYEFSRNYDINTITVDGRII